MSSLITDQHAMDPEVLVSLWSTSKPWNFGMQLWSGLARSWGLGMCLVVGVAVSQWGASVSLLSLWIPPVILYLTDHFINCPKTGGGAWLNVLHNSASVSATASGLSATVDYMANGRGRHWLDEHIGNVAPDMLALATVFSVTVLFVLGLERSTLLRAILILSVSSAVVFFTIIGSSLVDYTLFKQIKQLPETPSQVLHAAAFFTCAFAGVTSKQSSVAGLGMSALSYTAIIIILALTVEQQLKNPVVYLMKVFEIRDIWWARETISIFAILSLSLSLPELISSGQSSVDAVAGHILPSVISKENRTTGTQVFAIVITGLLSFILVILCSLENLLCLSSAAYLLTQVADILSAIHYLYQPLLPQNSLNTVFISNGGNYMLLANNSGAIDQTALLDSSEDERPTLSDDSGHSSDTDIDAIVAEYKEKLKVVTTLSEPLTLEPTLSTGRRVSFALIGNLVLASTSGLSLSYKYYWISAVSFIFQLLFFIIIVSQPHRQESPSRKRLPPWLALTILSVNVILACHLVAEVAVVLLLWSVLGLCLWFHAKRLHFCNFKGKLKRRKERIKLRIPPSHRTVTSYLPNYRRMTHVDTILITR